MAVGSFDDIVCTAFFCHVLFSAVQSPKTELPLCSVSLLSAVMLDLQEGESTPSSQAVYSSLRYREHV